MAFKYENQLLNLHPELGLYYQAQQSLNPNLHFPADGTNGQPLYQMSPGQVYLNNPQQVYSPGLSNQSYQLDNFGQRKNPNLPSDIGSGD